MGHQEEERDRKQLDFERRQERTLGIRFTSRGTVYAGSGKPITIPSVLPEVAELSTVLSPQDPQALGSVPGKPTV